MSTIVPAIGLGLITASILAGVAGRVNPRISPTQILNLPYSGLTCTPALSGSLLARSGVNIWVALLAGALFGAAFSVALTRALYTPFVRHGTGLFGMIIVTIAVSLIIQNGLQAIFGATFFSLRMSQGRSYHL